MTDDYPDDGPGWEQQYDNEARRWHEEFAKRLAKCEADMRVMRTWPEYKPDVEHAEEQEHEPERVEL